jgi:hypothetical protein
MKSAPPEGPRVIDAAERAKLHERYIDKFTAVSRPYHRRVDAPSPALLRGQQRRPSAFS